MGNILKVGLIYGLFSILSSLIITLIDKTFLFTGAYMGGSMIIGLIVLVVAGRKFFRNEEEGLLSYGAAMKSLFLASIIAMLLGNIFGIVRYSNDSEMKSLFKEYQIKTSTAGLRWGMELSGADEAVIDDAVAKAREDIEENIGDSYPYTWAKLPMNMISIIVMSLILALIAAIFVREKDTAYS